MKSGRKNVKPIAFYLPQFYRTKENDAWWGEGFTDWVAVRNAKPLFQGHQQPKVPLRGYYNLRSADVLCWQSRMAEKAGLYGFCFYHYWFKDGRQILEKPAELLLRRKDIPMRYCFSWANESWIRTWSNINGNAWADLFEQESPGGREETGILLEQEYGFEKEWRKHFEYLYPFFKDDRYITYDGKPVFLIYRPDLIPRLEHMVRCFRKWAKEQGLPGLYLIGTIHTETERQYKILDAVMLHNPNSAKAKRTGLTENGVECFRYSKIWKTYLRMKRPQTEKCYWCGVVDYDTTPRKGNKGCVLTGTSPAGFYRYFHQLVNRSTKEGNEFVFINAWNEWGEGMYLEPDRKNRYDFLNALRKSLR